MPSRTVRYFKRLTLHTDEPHSCSISERDALIRDRNIRGVPEEWCPTCKAVTEVEGRLDRTGVSIFCPFCSFIFP